MPMIATPSRWQFWIDRGGTFTDIVAQRPDGTLLTHKRLSDNPEQYPDAAVAGVRQMGGPAAGEPITPEQVECVKMGTTERICASACGPSSTPGCAARPWCSCMLTAARRMRKRRRRSRTKWVSRRSVLRTRPAR